MKKCSVSRQALVSSLLSTRRQALAAVLGAIALPFEAMAQQGNVLVIDMNRVRFESRAGTEIREASAALRQEIRGLIQVRERSIREEERKLAAERDDLSAEDFRERVQAFEQQVFDQRKFAEDESRRLQSLIARAQAQLTRATQRVLADVMRESGAELMLDKSQIVLTIEKLEVTAEVIKRLDQRLPAGSFADLEARDE